MAALRRPLVGTVVLAAAAAMIMAAGCSSSQAKDGETTAPKTPAQVGQTINTVQQSNAPQFVKDRLVAQLQAQQQHMSSPGGAGQGTRTAQAGAH